jgi:P4 family phage/plasmid primase-like protien
MSKNFWGWKYKGAPNLLRSVESMATNSIAHVLEAYAQEGLYAIPTKVKATDEGSKHILATMPHAKGNDAIRTVSAWRMARDRIMEKIEKDRFNFLAIKTGTISDIFVLDIDTRDKPEKDLQAGMPLWNRLIAEHGEPDTLRATSASGGLHYYFSYGESLNEGLQSGKCFAGVDYEGQYYGIDGRGDGGVVLAPPGSPQIGFNYTWCAQPLRTNIRPAPSWLIRFLNDSAKRSANKSLVSTSSDRIQELSANGADSEQTRGLESSTVKETMQMEVDTDDTHNRQAIEHKKIADAMMQLLQDAGLGTEVCFSGNVTSRGSYGMLYSFICHGPRTCIHGHQHTGSNNLTLVKRGWTVFYRCFGSECNEKPLTELGNIPIPVSLLDANPVRLHPTHDWSTFPNNIRTMSQDDVEAHMNLIRRNVTQRYRGMAAIFSAMYLVDGRIIAEGKCFHYWNGRRWIIDNAFHIQTLFSNHMARIMTWYSKQRLNAFKQEICANMRGSATEHNVLSTPESVLPDWALNPTTEEERKACGTAWRVVNKTYPFPTKRDLVDLTRGSEVRVCLEFVMNSLQAPQPLSEMMDIANPFLFACQNGVIDTETGKLLAFHPAHLCSRASKATFRGMPKAGSRFERFLLDCFNDDREVLEWYQLFCGYCMMAETSEQLFLVKQGNGANGKSLTKLASLEVLGSYAVVMSEDCIIEAGKRSAGAASSHIMALRGGRLAETDESGEKAVLNEAAMKALSSGGTTTGRELHSRQETFELTVKTVLNTNYKPILQNVSYCVTRRLALLPMLVTFLPPDKLDSSKPRQKLIDTTLEAYLKSDRGRDEGLSWYAEGARRYHELKRADPNTLPLMRRPRVMEEAVRAYINDSDIARRWIVDCLEFEDIQPGERATWHLAIGERLGEVFRAWLKEEDLTSSLSATALKKRILDYAEGKNRVVADGRFTDSQVQSRGQFKGLSGVRLISGYEPHA